MHVATENLQNFLSNPEVSASELLENLSLILIVVSDYEQVTV